MTPTAVLRALVAATTTLGLVTGCTAAATEPGRETSPPSSPTATAPTATATATATATQVAQNARVGNFPPYPRGRLATDVAASLQGALDAAVAQGTIRGGTAAVVVAGSGSWSGAAGVDRQGDALAADSSLLTASVGKTITAAQVMRLVEQGQLGLEDRAADHFPRELAHFDANGASIRDLLGMRSGLVDPVGYVELVDRGYRTADLMERTGPTSEAGTFTQYANINFLLLGEIIEQAAKVPLAKAVRAGVLSRPGLDGLVYGVKDAMAADGWNIETDAATLARWGYQLYGGFIVSDASLRAMTDFDGEFYGLGTIDFSPADEYGTPGAVGHGGMEESHAVRLVAFPDERVVIAVQANADSLEQVSAVVKALRDAARL
jgi:D-alanyl-D-alanine carboxypeptidase